MNSNLTEGIVRILTPDKRTAGTGFVVKDTGLIVTCAHVISSYKQDQKVKLIFYATTEEAQAKILTEFWRSRKAEDIAILQLDNPLPQGVEPLLLGEEEGTKGHEFETFGFPETKPKEGMWGYGKIGGFTNKENGSRVLQLTQSTEITRGFSGGPLLDSKRKRVIGMVNAVLSPDRLGKGKETSFITPTSILRKICPQLKVSDICPYQGLKPFGEEDAVYFYGRKQEIERVLDKLKETPPLLAIFGPSGSGKSSLIQAGVVPKLKQKKLVYTDSDRWAFIRVRPKEDPFQELAIQGLVDENNNLIKASNNWLSEKPEYLRLVLILDQFEEILVSCPEEVRQQFFAELLKLCASDLPVTVIIVMRNDFYAILAEQAPQLMETLGAGIVINISTKIDENNLKDIIKEPAKELGLRFEKGLVETIIQDIVKENSATDNQTSYAPSTILPLLEFALSQLWKDHEDGMMTHKTYQEMKGVTGSLSIWAEKTFREFKQPQLQDLVRRIFLELVHFGNPQESIPDSRRTRELKELLGLHGQEEIQGSGKKIMIFAVSLLIQNGLYQLGSLILKHYQPEQKQVIKVIKTLADKRLIITQANLNEDKIENDSTKVELIHEALLRDWPRFRQWIKTNRKFLEWLQTIETQAQRWQKTAQNIAKRDKDKLRQGNELLEAEKYYKKQKAELSQLVRDFIVSSIKYRQQQLFVKRLNKLIRIIGIVLFVFTIIYGGYYGPREEIKAFIESSENDLKDNKQLDALINSIKAAKSVQHPINQFLLPNILKLRTRANLTNSLHNAQEKNRLKGHAQKLTSVCFSANGEKIVSGSWDKTVKLWNKEGELLKILKQYPQIVTVSCASQAPIMISANKQGVIDIWDLEKKDQLINPLISKSMIFSLGISPDGQKVVSGDMNGKIKLWDIKNKEPLDTAEEHEGFVNSLSFSQDGNYLASADEEGSIRLWQVNSNRLIPFGSPWTDYEKEVLTVSFHPNRKLLVSGNGNGRIKLWNFQGEKLNEYYQHLGGITGLSFHPDGQMLGSTGDDGMVKLGWFRSERQLDFITLGKHRGGAAGIAFSQEDNLIASAGTDDRTIKLWHLPYYLYKQREEVVKALSRDGQRIVKVGSNLTLSTLDQSDSVILETLSSPSNIKAVAFSPSGDILASVKSDGTITLWNVPESLKQQKGIRLKNSTINNTIPINTITFSHDGQKLAAALRNKTTGTIKVWEVITGELERESEEKEEIPKIQTLHFGNNNQMLISGDSQGRIKVWHIESEGVKPKNTIEEAHEGAVSSFWVSPNGKLLASGSEDSTIKLWRIDRGTITEVEMTTPADHETAITSLTGSSDGQILASGSTDHRIKVWGVKNNSLIAIDTLEQYPQPIKALEFSQDGQILLSASDDNTVIQWDLNLDRLITEGCQHLRNYLKNNPQVPESDRQLCD